MIGKTETINTKRLANCLISGLLILGFILFIAAIYHSCKTETREYELSKLNSKYYGIYTSVHSNVPANNYETIILRCNDQVLTLDGDVNIWYVDSDYKVIWKDTNLVHGDEIDIYVPEGSIEFYYDVGISR